MSSKTCPICTKTVYSSEGHQFQGSTYHRACMKCQEAGCGVSLALSTANSYRDQIFCKKHFAAYAATGSVRGSSTAFATQYGGNAVGGLDADLAAKAAASLDMNVVSEAAAYINSCVPGANVSGSDAKSFGEQLKDGSVLKQLVGLTPKAGRVSAFDARSQITEFLNAAKAEGANRASFTVVDLYEAKNIGSVVNTIMDLKRARGGSTKVKSVTVSGGGDMCAVCNKKVYAAEAQKAIGKVFHRSCFKCSNCSAALSSATLLEYQGKPWCQRCHKKLAAPQGGNREQKTRGLDADLKAKQAAKFDMGAMAEAAQYVNSKTGASLSTTDQQAFADGLRNGMVLAQLANSWDSSYKVPSKVNKMAFGQRAQIGEFLSFLSARRVPTTFMTVDLFEDKNIGQVVLTLLTCKNMLK